MTLAILVTAYAVWRMVKKFEELATKASLGIDDVRRVTGEAQRVIATAHEATRGLQRGVAEFQEVGSQFQQVGRRALQISHLVLDEVERPARNALALVHGVKAGAAALLGRKLTHHSNHRYNGGDHVGF